MLKHPHLQQGVPTESSVFSAAYSFYSSYWGTALEIFQVGGCSPFSQLLLCGDIHPNPGPEINKCLKFFHWNLNSICARDRIKILLIETYDVLYKFDFIAISETMLDQTVQKYEIHIEDFSKEIYRSDHPSNTKTGGVSPISRTATHQETYQP